MTADWDRRRFLAGAASLAGAGSLAGCSGSESEPPESTPTPTDTTTPTNTATPEPTETTDEATQTETPEPDLTGREHYFNWIHGEDDQILEEVQGTQQNTSISFQAIDNALEEGIENGGRNQAIANALETASQEYQENNNYEDRHTHILSALHQTLEQKNGDQWDFDIFSMKDWGKSTAFPKDGIDYSKIWVENEDGEYTDINAGLSERYEHTTHIPGEDIGNTAKNISNRIKEQLQFMRDSESFGTRPAHDLETHLDRLEYDRESLDREYSDEELEQGFGSWLDNFSNYVLGEGNAVPSSKEDWKAFHRGIENGPEIFLNLNEAYHNSDYDGETAQFTVEDRNVSVEEVPEGYNPAEDGIPGNPAA
ncbi:hypothetical protein GOC74_03355 [Halomicrobium mukohataei]|uniref:Uncharacterized protein n=1 Tax=Halomicrobium mukohataei TaxID=57705 RepID=A0A847U9Q2_9EURY|nr:hypothetical protein [Halomicrobium mukohataei]NLV08967.1 hypothetical protein [Halomicrobium mukohataei]